TSSASTCAATRPRCGRPRSSSTAPATPPSRSRPPGRSPGRPLPPTARAAPPGGRGSGPPRRAPPPRPLPTAPPPPPGGGGAPSPPSWRRCCADAGRTRPEPGWHDRGVTEAGKQTATLRTTLGDIRINLFPDHAPKTVANFVGLATGEKPYSQPNAKGGTSGP